MSLKRAAIAQLSVRIQKFSKPPLCTTSIKSRPSAAVSLDGKYTMLVLFFSGAAAYSSLGYSLKQYCPHRKLFQTALKSLFSDHAVPFFSPIPPQRLVIELLTGQIPVAYRLSRDLGNRGILHHRSERPVNQHSLYLHFG